MYSSKELKALDSSYINKTKKDKDTVQFIQSKMDYLDNEENYKNQMNALLIPKNHRPMVKEKEKDAEEIMEEEKMKEKMKYNKHLLDIHKAKITKGKHAAKLVKDAKLDKASVIFLNKNQTEGGKKGSQKSVHKSGSSISKNINENTVLLVNPKFEMSQKQLMTNYDMFDDEQKWHFLHKSKELHNQANQDVINVIEKRKDDMQSKFMLFQNALVKDEGRFKVKKNKLPKQKIIYHSLDQKSQSSSLLKESKLIQDKDSKMVKKVSKKLNKSSNSEEPKKQEFTMITYENGERSNSPPSRSRQVYHNSVDTKCYVEVDNLMSKVSQYQAQNKSRNKNLRNIKTSFSKKPPLAKSFNTTNVAQEGPRNFSKIK